MRALKPVILPIVVKPSKAELAAAQKEYKFALKAGAVNSLGFGQVAVWSLPWKARPVASAYELAGDDRCSGVPFCGIQ